MIGVHLAESMQQVLVIAADGISVWGLSAAVIADRSVTYLAFQDASESKKARTTLELDLDTKS